MLWKVPSPLGKTSITWIATKGSRDSACVYTNSSCGCASTTVTQLLPLHIPGSWWHPHHTGCHGCARSWLAWVVGVIQLPQMWEVQPHGREGKFQQGESPALTTPDAFPIQLWTQPSIPPAGGLPVRMSWKIIGNTQRTDLAEFGPHGPADQVFRCYVQSKGMFNTSKVKVSPE